MNPSIRIVLCAVYLQSLVMLLNTINPGWSEDLTLEINRLIHTERERQELQGQLDTIQVCREAKKEVVNDLLAHRLTLREAAARFQEMNAQQMNSAWREELRKYYGSHSDEERHCQEVITFTHSVLLDESPAEAAAVTQRLADELRELPAGEAVEVGGEE